MGRNERAEPTAGPDGSFGHASCECGTGAAKHQDVLAQTVKGSPCKGCGAVLPDVGGPVHAYMESSAACWARYSEVLAREYADRGLIEGTHRLTVDSYAAQHPGRASAQCIQSVAGHLISLCAVIEYGASSERATKVIREAVRMKGRFSWLQPPQSLGPITVVDVWEANGAAAHEELVKDWASSGLEGMVTSP